MKIAVTTGRAQRPKLKLGICGEHGGDPASVEFCHEIGLDYVSCSPYRLPIARLAAAQAVLSRQVIARGCAGGRVCGAQINRNNDEAMAGPCARGLGRRAGAGRGLQLR